MAVLGTQERPLRVAIIGSGPSGFYAAEFLLAQPRVVKVDMFEKFPTPFGLVRYGVAPDHAKIKNVIKAFEKITQHPLYSFLGNVEVGKHISVAEMRQYYDALVFAQGAESDRHLNIKGEDLKGSYTATALVAWYNGHPDFQDIPFDFSCETAVIMGQGNVALDIARILAKTPEELKKTDITQQAFDALVQSQIKNIYMIGRRGPMQTAFTLPEIKEMADLADCYPVVDPMDLELNEASLQEYQDPAYVRLRKNYDVLKSFMSLDSQNRRRKFMVRFLRTPVEILGHHKVEGIRLQRNELKGIKGQQKAHPTQQFEDIPCGLFFRSIGYTGIPLEGLPFSESRGVIPNTAGRVLDQDKILPGVYVVGWIKTGAVGSIGANKPPAKETVDCLLSDVDTLSPCPHPHTHKVLDVIQGRTQVITFADWKKIDVMEVRQGLKAGKPREKITRVQQMLSSVNDS